MTEEINYELPPNEELEDLKQQAALLGIKHSPNIGVDTLRAKVKEALTKTEEASPKSDHTVNQDKRRAALKLIRCRIINRDPSKNEIPGTIITMASDNTGIIRKWIPFHGYENGYHIPKIIYDALKEKKYLKVSSIPNPDNPRETIIKKDYLPEYDIVELPPLTQKELNELAMEQKATGMV